MGRTNKHGTASRKRTQPAVYSYFKAHKACSKAGRPPPQAPTGVKAFLTGHFFRFSGDNTKVRDDAVGVGIAEAKNGSPMRRTKSLRGESQSMILTSMRKLDGRWTRGGSGRPRLRIQRKARPLLVLEERTWRWWKPTARRTECPIPTAFSF
jgi:hypothetical protein